MSKKYPECPLYNHATCKELHNPKSCAIIRDDKFCSKKRQQIAKPEKHVTPGSWESTTRAQLS